MLTFSDDFEELRFRLNALGYGLTEADRRTVDALVAVLLTLDSFDLPEDRQRAILDLLSTTGRQTLEKVPGWTEESWQEFDYGNVRTGDFVRVKPDAYDSDSGARHNGLVGTLNFMSGRVCTVDYLGLATGNTHKHPMEKLQSLKGVYNRRPTK